MTADEGSTKKHEIVLKYLEDIKDRVEKAPQTEGNASVGDEVVECSDPTIDDIAELTAKIDEELESK